MISMSNGIEAPNVHQKALYITEVDNFGNNII